MKMKISVIFLSTIALVLFLVSCSEDRSPAQSYSTHVIGWTDAASVNFHGQLGSCELCHSAQYDTTQVSSTCRTCHSSQPLGDLVSCTTCHGLPPVDDSTLPRGMAPGAAGGHEAMVVEKGYACTECHAPVTDLSHIGSLPAEVVFAPNSIARARGHAPNPYDPTYLHVGEATSGNGTCAVYCHSNGNGGPPNDPVPEWTATMEFTCTSCHSIPPTSPHPQVPTCHTCHSNVNPASQYPNDIRFINEQLHVNGVVDL